MGFGRKAGAQTTGSEVVLLLAGIGSKEEV